MGKVGDPVCDGKVTEHLLSTVQTTAAATANTRGRRALAKYCVPRTPQRVWDWRALSPNIFQHTHLPAGGLHPDEKEA